MHKIQFDVNVANGIAIDVATAYISLVDGGVPIYVHQY